ncbi:MAG: dipeptide ABC transporter ATP-binding protein [Nitrospirae bacterium]|nr:dipeptide ABC transporter ATP-binding protein [Nitrospirota bacterium]MBI3352727.1 dipeptide ABC transporter ATP-binding protein [Nitrospirota bacterium]
MPLLSVSHLKKYFPVKGSFFSSEKKVVHAVDDVSFDLFPGEVLGLVGESGSGKSTTGRLILRLIEPTSGSVFYNGEDILKIDSKRMRALRREIQIIFQDPFSSLNPRMTIGKILEEPFIIHKIGDKKERKEKVLRLLEKIGLHPDAIKRYPHEFSGGQRQRIGIARAIALSPKLIIADEPISSLDVSIQAQIINLLEDLQKEFNLSLLFIAHDLNMVRHLSDRVAVMYLGRIVELAKTEELFKNPKHPYTEALLSAIPIPDPTRRQEKILLSGDIPSPIDLPTGCRFQSRCPKKIKECETIDPPLYPAGDDHEAACILVKN